MRISARWHRLVLESDTLGFSLFLSGVSTKKKWLPLAVVLSKRFLVIFLLLTATFDGTQMSFYIDGIFCANLTGKNITTWSNYRTSNFIGKSNWPWDGYSMSYVDELRFYNKCLTQEDIYGLISNDTSKPAFISFKTRENFRDLFFYRKIIFPCKMFGLGFIRN